MQDVVKKDWFLKMDHTDIGFWPSKIFTNLGNTATQTEWGGEVFSPLGVPAPGMGSGHELEEDTTKDAFFANANIVVNNTIVDPPRDLKLLVDSIKYDVRNEGNVGDGINYLIFYGGVGGGTGS